MTVILSTKLKNALKKEAEKNGMELEFHLSNISINGEKRGCSGFVKNPANGSIVYVNTERPVLSTLPNFLYRYARHLKDYAGYRNHGADTFPQLVSGICYCLTKTPQEAKD